ncbi:hypothetical protein [Azoarcus olearius]|uniref:Conserved hypothetical membrane protein n=1 Tax=Azoarcus sp. (strain BH72) TaxID=418699 RepID=A1K7A4_AZOSB|nr:hypothetical protein [Azoarcus olearius]CAL94709.1 conserved hypothetical membrane protein [Azoarcus olearius]
MKTSFDILPALHQALRRTHRLLGPAGLAGIALLLLALGIDRFALPQLDSAQRRLAAERNALLRAAAAQDDAPTDERSALEAYYASRFPPQRALGERLSVLYSLAADHGLDVRRVDYRAASEPGTRLRRITLDLPLEGDFPRIHGWLGAALQALPELTLETVSVKRASSESARIEAELRLVLWVGEGR